MDDEFPHEVPDAVGRVVHMADSQHPGTDVYRTEGDEWVFVDRARETVTFAERCVLVELSDTPSLELLALKEAAGFDGEAGLALLPLAPWADANDYGVVLWDSATPTGLVEAETTLKEKA